MRTLIIYSTPFLLYTAALRIPSDSNLHRNISYHPYTHSYAPTYSIHGRDGWETVSISDLDHKYTRNGSTEDTSSQLDGRHALQRRSRKHKGQDSNVDGAIRSVVDTALKGIGKIEQVTITWYTGKDLQNPSCWRQSVWTPTDDSFACAVTLEGWINRPQCFKFLELCNGSQKCVFVRVVDTCAGCVKGSKHVDLTKAAFQALASLDQGKLQVQMRLATDPKQWHEVLWGPKQS